MTGTDVMVIKYMESMEQPETRSLGELYGYRDADQSAISRKLKEIERLPDATELLAKWREIDPAQADDLRMDEEQEREVFVEVQQLKTVQHPLSVGPKKPVVRGDVWEFVETGMVNASRFRAGKDLSLLDLYPVTVMLERTSAVSNKNALV